MGKIKRAVISVFEKEGLIPFAAKLARMGVEIISTGGTYRLLKDNSVPVTEVSAVTGFPEILEGRVKTLHPKIHGGILARREKPDHLQQLSQHSIHPIDMVVVNLYPFEATVSRPGVLLEEALENIDIGGPTLLRAAAKNYRDVVVVVDPHDYSAILEEMEKRGGDISPETRFFLARKVFHRTSRYDSLISSYLETQGAGKPAAFPQTVILQFEKLQNLRYGENPHQQGAFYRDPRVSGPCIARARQLAGKDLSYNNVLDADSALELAREFEEPVAVIVKHNNPCGVAVADSQVKAYRMARECDPLSAFGGVIAFNSMLDAETAREITSTFMEVVIAPGFEKDALEVCLKKKDVRLLDVGPTVKGSDRGQGQGIDMRSVGGGLLLQERDAGPPLNMKKLRVVTKRQPTEDEYQALDFSWRVARHVKSNAIVFARSGQTLGIGAGQMSRVDSVKIATMKARLPLAGAAMASDAFFPFRDGIDEAARCGIAAVIQPGGSIKDEEVIRAADEHNMAMVFTGVRHFRH